MALTSAVSRVQTAQAVIVRLPLGARNFRARQCQQLSSRRHGTTAARNQAAHAARTGERAAREGIDAARKAGNEVKHEASAAADDVIQRTKNAAGQVPDTQEMIGKAKQTAEVAWDAVKDNAQKVVHRAEKTANTVKHNLK